MKRDLEFLQMVIDHDDFTGFMSTDMMERLDQMDDIEALDICRDWFLEITDYYNARLDRMRAKVGLR